MFEHRVVGPFGIMPGNGFINGGMPFERILHQYVRRLEHRCGTLFGKPVGQRIVQRDEDGILGYLRQNVMKCEIGASERLPISDRLLVLGKSRTQATNLFGRRMTRGMAREAAFEQKARLLKVGDAIALREKGLGTMTELVQQAGAVEVSDLRPCTIAKRDQAARLKRQQRLADRGPADPELVDQFALRWQQRFVGILAGMNLRRDFCGYRLVDAASRVLTRHYVARVPEVAEFRLVHLQHLKRIVLVCPDENLFRHIKYATESGSMLLADRAFPVYDNAWNQVTIDPWQPVRTQGSI